MQEMIDWIRDYFAANWRLWLTAHIVFGFCILLDSLWSRGHRREIERLMKEDDIFK